ncbi:MAG TPA: hypothetical protein VGR79_02400 [Stellaceae bacterium]|nr:hypothetical protein [Stellaceae bacterium]
MTDATTPPTDDERAKRKAAAERRTLIMWGYVTGFITFISYVVGLEPSFIPLGFGVLGCIIAWQLNAKGERHGLYAGMINLAGILIWITYNWSRLRGWVGG